MSFLSRLLGREDDRQPMRPCYAATVAAAREPGWYVDGGVPDTLDGRFDMVAAIMSLVLIRLEAEGEKLAAESALLTEIFVEDMDGQLREIGIGDVVVGKHLGRMMSALGGRLGAYREGLSGAPGILETALVRNLYRGEAPGDASVGWAAAEMRRLFGVVKEMPAEKVIAGEWFEK